MSRRIVIVGAGAQARYALNTLRLLGGDRAVALIDTFGNPEFWGREIHGVRVAGDYSALDQYPPADDQRVVVAISDIAEKIRAVDMLTGMGHTFLNIIHPSAVIADSVQLGTGSIINANVTIEPDTRVGDHVIIHAGSVIEHDNVIESYVNIGPGVTTAGRVAIRQGAVLYTRAFAVPGVEIGAGAVIGAGAGVLKSIGPGVVAVGVPAKPISRKAAEQEGHS